MRFELVCKVLWDLNKIWVVARLGVYQNSCFSISLTVFDVSVTCEQPTDLFQFDEVGGELMSLMNLPPHVDVMAIKNMQNESKCFQVQPEIEGSDDGPEYTRVRLTNWSIFSFTRNLFVVQVVFDWSTIDEPCEETPASHFCVFHPSESEMLHYMDVIDQIKAEILLRNTHVMETDSRYGFLYLGDFIYAFYPSLETALILPKIFPSEG